MKETQIKPTELLDELMSNLMSDFYHEIKKSKQSLKKQEFNNWLDTWKFSAEEIKEEDTINEQTNPRN